MDADQLRRAKVLSSLLSDDAASSITWLGAKAEVTKLIADLLAERLTIAEVIDSSADPERVLDHISYTLGVVDIWPDGLPRDMRNKPRRGWF